MKRSDATGDFVAFDADDVRVEDSVVSKPNVWQRDPKSTSLLAERRYSDRPGTSTFFDHGCPVLLLYLSSGLFRRELFSAQRCGPFDENYRQGEDADWFLRARENGVHFCLEDEMACRYRRHGANLTTDKSANQRFFFNALRESLRRRRGDALSAAPLPPWNGIAKG
jgi:hypothetical protein